MAERSNMPQVRPVEYNPTALAFHREVRLNQIIRKWWNQKGEQPAEWASKNLVPLNTSLETSNLPKIQPQQLEAIKTSIDEVGKLSKDKDPMTESKFRSLTEETINLFNHFGDIGIVWKHVTPPSVHRKLVGVFLNDSNTGYIDESLGGLLEAFLKPTPDQLPYLGTISTFLQTGRASQFDMQMLNNLETVDESLQKSNKENGLPVNDHAVPWKMLVEGRKSDGKWHELMLYLRLLQMPGSENYPIGNAEQSKLQQLRREAFDLGNMHKSRDADIGEIRASMSGDQMLDENEGQFHPSEEVDDMETSGQEETDEDESSENEEPLYNPPASTDGERSGSGQDQGNLPNRALGNGQEQVPGNVQNHDEEEQILFQMDDPESYPKGSKTVAWGERRGGLWYINRLGPAAACVYREQDSFIPGDDKTDWHNPPQNLNVTNPINRIGEERTLNNKPKYTKRHIVGIFGVSFNSDKQPFPDLPAFEAMNQENYKKYNENRPEGAKLKRFIGCHIRVGWNIDGKIVKTWELRETLRGASRWKQKAADKAIYEAAKAAQIRYDGGEGVSSRDTTPADAASIARQGRELSYEADVRRGASPVIRSTELPGSPQGRLQTPQSTSRPSVSPRLLTPAMTPQPAPLPPPSGDSTLEHMLLQQLLAQRKVNNIFDLPLPNQIEVLKQIKDLLRAAS